MSETLTNTPINQSETNAAAIEQMHSDYEALQNAENPSLINESFDDAIALQAADIGKRYVEESTPQPKKMSEKVKDGIFYTGAGIAIVGSATAGVAGLVALGNETEPVPTFSEETTTYTVKDGDGIYNAAESIAGINTIDVRDAVSHITSDPVNIDVLKDGLQAGEQLVVPVSINGVETPNE